MEKQKTLLELLKNYGRSDYYPFHMPGHKRQIRAGLEQFPNPFEIDITEIFGFDNLHHPEECLKRSMERAACLYGADKTYFMVNGSTGGILSAISGCVSFGGKILLARNSHKSAYHAVMLRHLSPVYLEPEFIEEFQIQGGIEPETVRKKLEAEPDIQAVFLTSPTYEGIVSNIEEIAKIVHKYKIPLIVDEAHGACFPFGGFPKSALECGADVVIQSLHKTLPSLTQTAVLHLNETYVKRRLIEKYLQIYQTSSPSYVFLASIEQCILYMEENGREELENFSLRLKKWMKRTEKFHALRVLSDRIKGADGVWDRDASKIVIAPDDPSLTGNRLAEILRERYHLEAEMACSKYTLCMTSFMDSEEGMERLFLALEEIDRELEMKNNGKKPGKNPNRQKERELLTWIRNVEKRMEPFEADESEEELILLSEAKGRISRGFITVYPPGVPAVVPGEVISEEAIETLGRNQRLGLTVEGIFDEGKIEAVKEKRRE